MNEHDARARLLLRANRYAFPIPDAVMALILAGAAFGAIPPHAELVSALVVEGGFLFTEAALVDVATRLKKRLPLWAVVLIAAGIALFTGGLAPLREAWGKGWAVFIPLLFSLGERAAVLWRMPERPRVQKIAARALISNRITMAMAALALIAAAMIAGMIFLDAFDTLNGPMTLFGAGAIYFAVAAFDEWRVRGRRFAERPSVLFRFDPIHHDYLEPV